MFLWKKKTKHYSVSIWEWDCYELYVLMYAVFPIQGLEVPATHHVSFISDIGICWKRVQKKSKGSTLSFASLPLPTHTVFLICSQGELCRNKLWDNSAGSEFAQALQKDTSLPETTPCHVIVESSSEGMKPTRNFWCRWMDEHAGEFISSLFSSSCERDLWDVLPRESACRKTAWVL